MRLVAATIMLLALAGCADTTSRARLARQQLREAEAVEAIYDQALAAPSFALLADKVNLREVYHRGEAPCAAIKEDRLPTAEERVALRQWASLRQSYLVKLDDILLGEPSGSSHAKRLIAQFDVVTDNALRSQSVLIEKLADGDLTYCQFAEFDKEWTENTVRQIDAIRRELRQVAAWEYGTRGTAPNP